ncbi:transcriptional regulator domain-containing protein [Burkholderia diffusa]|uniref:transcriptional regulator domain-containing protein n=1 Tax=Burkholderia diffusa TaxID=488732 RepID=UPI003B8A8981
MVADPVPVQHRLFIAREDWRDDAKYPPTKLQDPSIGAWELLRRNNQYAQDFADWHQRVTDVPPLPFPKMFLDGYFCAPEPESGTTYEQYRAKHPNHLVLPLLDHIRERWGITRLFEPTSVRRPPD